MNAPSSSPVAIVDIGSNSLRLVIYDQPGRKPLQDIKIACGLGRDLEKTGKLNPDAALIAYHAISGFYELSIAFGASVFFPFATAALRDAKDGSDFVRKIRKELGVQISVIAGEDEARLSALGVAASVPGLTGIVCDLGGGSMELAKVANGIVTDTLSLPLGTLRMKAYRKKELNDALKTQLDTIPEAFRNGQALYGVGGSIKNYVQAYLRSAGKERKKGEEYFINPSDLSAFALDFIDMPPEKMIKHHGVSEDRTEVMPVTAHLLTELTKTLKTSKITASSTGLREGVLHALAMENLLQKMKA